MSTCRIEEIEVFLPAGRLTNSAIEKRFPEWPAAKIEEKLGVVQRAIAGPQEFTSDLAVAAGEGLIGSGRCRPEEIDFLIVCTQTPDLLAPTTACIVHQRLGLKETAAAVDINQGCSGYIYGLSYAKALVESGQSRKLLLITADTYTKFIDPADKNLVTLFGDGAAATLLAADAPAAGSKLGPFYFATDGSGANNLSMRGTGTKASPGQQPRLFMNGPEIFNFAINAVPKAVHGLLEAGKVRMEDIDLFVFHQANSYMLEHLRRKLGVPVDKFVLSMAETGNTVSSSIPIALKECLKTGRLKRGMRVLLLGFGVGYSTAGALVEWTER